MTWYYWILAVASFLTAVSGIITFVIKTFKKARKMADLYDQVEGMNNRFESGTNAINLLINKLDSANDKIDSVDEKINSVDEKVIGLTKSFEEHKEQNIKQTQLLVEEAREVLLNEMEKSIDLNYASVEHKIRIGDLFAQQGANGGNHGVKDIFEIYKMLPTSPEESIKK